MDPRLVHGRSTFMAAPTDAVQVVTTAVFVFMTLADGLGDDGRRESHVQI
jgi:hypothetical protein